MAEYGSMFAVSGLAAILFFGGWNGPLPISQWLGLTDSLHPLQFAAEHPLAHYLGNLLGLGNFIGKCVFGVTFMMWVRWTLPRLRIDQVMTTCLKYCTPIAAAMFLGATLWSYAFPGGWILKTAFPLGEVREGWIVEDASARAPAASDPLAAKRVAAATRPTEEGR